MRNYKRKSDRQIYSEASMKKAVAALESTEFIFERAFMGLFCQLSSMININNYTQFINKYIIIIYAIIKFNEYINPLYFYLLLFEKM